MHCAGIRPDSSRCFFGAVPPGVSGWASFNHTFTPAADVITVYISQNGTDSTVVSNLDVQQLIGTPRPIVAPRALRNVPFASHSGNVTQNACKNADCE